MTGGGPRLMTIDNHANLPTHPLGPATARIGPLHPLTVASAAAGGSPWGGLAYSSGLTGQGGDEVAMQPAAKSTPRTRPPASTGSRAAPAADSRSMTSSAVSSVKAARLC